MNQSGPACFGFNKFPCNSLGWRLAIFAHAATGLVRTQALAQGPLGQLKVFFRR